MESNVIETRTARIWLGEDGILRVFNKPGVKIDLPAAKENIAASMRTTEGRKAPMLIGLDGIKSIGQDARELFAGKDGAEPSLCQALLVGSPFSKVIGNFFLGINKPVFPTRLFTSEADALAWLRGFQE